MVVEGGSCERDLRIVGREYQRRGEKLRKERWENLSFEVKGRTKEKTEVAREASFLSGLHIDEITQIWWFRFMQEIVSNGYDFLLYALFDLEPVKRFECMSDVWVLMSAGNGAS